MTSSFSAIKRQYFLAHGVIGSLTPFLSVFLQHKGLSQTQIGFALALSGIAVLLSPVVLSLLADGKWDSRRIMAWILIVGAAALGGLGLARSFGAILLALCAQSLAYVAILPLMDALTFAQLEKQNGEAKPVRYEQLRVWGTIGFILPGALLFVVLYAGGGLNWILVSGAFFSVLCALNARFLPPSRDADATIERKTGARLPTGEAARALARRPVLIFCVSMFLAGLSSAAWYGFFPIYLTGVVGLQDYWLAPINNIGVMFEIGFMLMFGPMLAKLGFKNLILIGLSCLTLRLALLAVFPIPGVAVATQIIHGMVVVTTMVAPATYLNRQANERFRNSIQGLYTMAFAGSSRVLGSYIAGYIAQKSVLQLFAVASVVSCAAVVLLFFFFRDEQLIES